MLRTMTARIRKSWRELSAALIVDPLKAVEEDAPLSRAVPRPPRRQTRVTRLSHRVYAPAFSGGGLFKTDPDAERDEAMKALMARDRKQ